MIYKLHAIKTGNFCALGVDCTQCCCFLLIYLFFILVFIAGQLIGRNIPKNSILKTNLWQITHATIFFFNYFEFVEGDDGNDDEYHNGHSCQRDQSRGPIRQSISNVPSTGNKTTNFAAFSCHPFRQRWRILKTTHFVAFAVTEMGAP